MAVVCTFEDALARLEKAESGGINGSHDQAWNGKYYGAFQIGKAEWAEGGGDPSKWHNGATYEEQKMVAKKVWERKQQAGGATTCCEAYVAWNLGEGSLRKMRTVPLATIGETGVKGLINGQAWGRNFPANMTNAEAMAHSCYYFTNGKADATKGIDEKGQEWISPGVDKSIGANGVFGGIIWLYLVDRDMSKEGYKWTTEKTKNPRQLFIIPCCVGFNGPDSFISQKGEIGTLETDFATGLPFAMCGATLAIFTFLGLTTQRY